MSLSQIGQNSAQEFFETLIYLTAYDEARQIIQNYTKDIDDPILQEAVNDALNVLTFGLIFYLIQMEENFLERVFSVASGIVLALLAPFGKIKKRFRGRKGIKGIFNALLGRFSNSDRIQLANFVANQTNNLIQARNNSYQSNTLFKSYTDTKQNIYTREMLHLNLADSYSKQYIQSLMFKLFTKSFTPQDEVLLKKILGRDVGANISIDDINQVADFMFVKDSNGKVIGLSEAFLELINGLGYLHK